MQRIPCCWTYLVIVAWRVSSVNTECEYRLSPWNQTSPRVSVCRSEQCGRVTDPESIIVHPLDCKSRSLSLTFSSWTRFDDFLNRLQWPLSSLFSSRWNGNVQRRLTIFLHRLDRDDQPLSHDQLLRLGEHIDLYTLLVYSMANPSYFLQSIHHDLHYPRWNIFHVKL